MIINKKLKLNIHEQTILSNNFTIWPITFIFYSHTVVIFTQAFRGCFSYPSLCMMCYRELSSWVYILNSIVHTDPPGFN